MNVMCYVHLSLCKGVYSICGGRQGDCGDRRQKGTGLGPQEHGLCPAEERVQSQVPNTLHSSLPQQAGKPQLSPEFVYS